MQYINAFLKDTGQSLSVRTTSNNMKFCPVFLLALGIAAAADSVARKLTVFGVPGVASVWDTVGSSVLGVKSIYPYNVPLSVNHFLPYNVYYPNIPNLVRNDLQSVPVSLRDVYNRPVMMVVKSTSGDEGLTVYFLEYGLSSLAENPQTKFIHDAIKSGAEKTAVVIHPTVLQNTPAFKIIKDLLVVKAYVPVGIKFGHFINSISHNTPYVFIHDKDDVSTFDLDGLVRVGTLDVAEEKVHCISCY